MTDDTKQGVRLFREFLNLGAEIFDSYEVDDDNLPATDSYGKLKTYKSVELLEWMGKVRKWCKEDAKVSLTKEDDYDFMEAKNDAVKTLQDTFGLTID